jgi:hypothetical protein
VIGVPSQAQLPLRSVIKVPYTPPPPAKHPYSCRSEPWKTPERKKKEEREREKEKRRVYIIEKARKYARRKQKKPNAVSREEER